MIFLVIILLIGPCLCEHNLTEQCPNVRTSVGSMRKKRHLAFPDGSNAVITISLAKTFLTHVPSAWYVVMDLDVLFALPDEKFSSEQRRKKHHRQKREFWKRVEEAIYFHNLDGRACVLRSICESQRYLAPPGRSLVHDILRAIFTAPLNAEEFQNTVGDEYKEIFEPNFCDRVEDCPLSILHFIFALNKKNPKY